MAISVGSVEVDVVPNTRGIYNQLRGALVPAATRAGNDAGRAAGERFGPAMAGAIDNSVAARIGQQLGRQIAGQITAQIRSSVQNGVVQGGRRAQASATRQGGDAGGRFGQAFRTRLEAAVRSLPDITIGADTSEAEADIRALREQMATLADQRVGIDVDAATARRQIEELERQLTELGARHPDVAVRINTRSAIAELAALRTEINRLDGQDVDVDVNTRSATANMHLLTTAALAFGPALLPALPVAAAGLGAIAAAATAAGAGLGALAIAAVPAVMDISKALQAQKAAQDAATNATASGGQAAVQAQQRAMQMAGAQQALAAAHRSAAKSIRDAERGVTDAVRQAAEANAAAAGQVRAARQAVADAVQQAADRQQQATERVSAAERSLADAQRTARQAQLDLTQARRDAAAELEDLGNRLAGAQLSERDATLAVQRAQLRLTAVRQAGAKATLLDQQEAQLAYDQAVQRLREQQLSTKRLTAEKKAADKAGVEGSDTVRSAQERLASAQRAVRDGQAGLAKAQAEASRTQIENTRSIAEAQEKLAAAQANVSKAQADSARSVQRAHEALAQARVSAAAQIASAERQVQSASLASAGGVDQAAAAQAKYQQALAAMTPAARGTFNAFNSLSAAFKGWSRSLQPTIMPLFTRALIGLKNSLPGLTPFVLAAARAVGTLQDRVSRGFKSPWWQQFKKDLSGSVEPAIVGLGVSFGRIFKGMAGIVQAFLPHMSSISQRMQDITGRFATWGTSLKGSPEFERFLSYSAEQAPILARSFGDVARAFMEVSRALSPLSGPALQILGALARGIASIAESLPWLIQGMYLALIATRLWTIGMALFNLVMAANPITLIVIAIVALVAAVIYAWKNFGWFRTAVMAAWEGIKTAALWAWNTVLKPVFNALAAIVKWLWNYIIKPYFNFVMAYWRMVASVAMWLWKTILAPVFRAIGKLIALWWAGVKKYFSFVMFIVRNAAKVIFWFWKNVIMLAVRAIVQLFKWWWAGVKRYFNFVRAIIRVVASAFKWLYDKGIKPPLNWIADKAKWIWNKGIKPAFDKIKSGIRLVGESFDKGQKAIGKAWNKIKDATKKPIRWVIETVYNGGVVKLWNMAAKVLPLDKLQKINLKGFARGGIIPGYQPARRDDVLTPMRRGEGVLVPEVVRGIGPQAIQALNDAGNRGGVSAVRRVVGYAEGGIVGHHGGLGDWFGGKVRQLGGLLGKAKDWVLGGVTSAAKAAAKPIRDLIGRVPGAKGGWGKLVRAVPRGILSSVLSAIKGSEDEQTSGAQWIKPVDAKYGTKFGVAGPMWSSGRHTGLDFPAAVGKAVSAVAGGTITSARSGGPYGKHIAISHGGGLSSLYAHLSSISRDGGAVKQGQRIGAVGATGNVTGPHLHLEARLSGKPVDPMAYITGGAGGGAGVQRWRGLVLSVLKELGQPASLAGTVLRRMQQESGGNPRAVNNYDINAQRGDPSKGLMQVIGSTFRAYAGKYRSRGVWDPRANIYASMRYALSRYGSLSRAYNRPGGYDEGGWLMPGQLGYNGLRQPEAVLTPGQWRSITSLAAQGGGGGLRPGDSLRLVVGDQEFDAYVDGRADGRVAVRDRAMLQTVRAGRRG